MAFVIQYRNLCKRVKQQLTEFDDQEKGKKTPSPRLSGDTTRGAEDGEKNASADDETKQSEKDQFPYAAIDGISVQTSKNGDKFYQVDWESESDPQNPRTWSTSQRMTTTLVLVSIAFVVTAASSIDSAIAPQAARAFGVSDVTEALAGTGVFLIGFGFGALAAGPLSEMLGRYPVYMGTLIIFGCWILGAALSPNIGAQIVFRCLAGFCGAAPLTVSGGTMSDIWTTKEKTWAFPIFAIVGFGGPVLGPVMASYIGVTGVLSWRWSEWVILILDGVVITLVFALKRETLAPRLLLYKASHLRKLTGDKRFMTAQEAEGKSVVDILKVNFTRPFILALEPIVFLFTLYLTIVYIILFTFLDGYPYIFDQTYGIGQGLANICFLGLLVGIVLSMVTVPLVVRITKKQLARDGDDGSGKAINQETRLIFAMIGAPLIPIGLFWMGWTDYPSISIWSPLVASVVIGFGIICIFMSAYMYIIDSYQVYAASALTFVALVRYVAAGGMTVVGIPMYKNLNNHWTLTVLGCTSVLIMPVPYVLYVWGHKVRAKSQYAVSQ